MVSLVASMWFSSAVAQDLLWKEIYTDDGVTVSRSSVPGTRLVAFRGQTVMEAPIGKIVAVLVDDAHREDWVGRLYTSQTLTSTSPFDFVTYQAYKLPAPFSNRDYVFRAVMTRDPATGVIRQSLQSVEHPDAPETVGVRANLVNSQYLLTPLPNGDTQVVVEILTDPMGSMPAWIVNLIQRTWPRDTLNGIRAQLGKAWVTEHPLP